MVVLKICARAGGCRGWLCSRAEKVSIGRDEAALYDAALHAVFLHDAARHDPAHYYAGLRRGTADDDCLLLRHLAGHLISTTRHDQM